MKKVLSLVAIAIVAMFANQTFAQFTAVAGYQNVKSKLEMKFTNNTTQSTTASMNGFYVGGNYNINLVGDLGIAPGLTFNFATYSSSDAISKVTLTRIWLELPVMVNYGFEISNDMRVTFMVGPKFNLGLSFKQKSEYPGGTTLTGDRYSKDDMGTNSAYKRFNMGVAGGVAFNYKAIDLHCVYTLGLLSEIDSEYGSSKYNTLAVGLGYTF